MKKIDGITLITLVITIIILLILSGVTIAMLTGDNGLLTKAKKTEFISEITKIQEEFNLYEMAEESRLKFGKLSEIIEIIEKYDKMLYVEEGNIVYNKDCVNQNQKEWLEECSIYEGENLIPIFNREQLQEIGSGKTIYIEDIKRECEFKSTSYYSIQNDIEINGNENDQWNPISDFDGKLKGNGYEISGIYVTNSNKTSVGLFELNKGIIDNLKIKNITLAGGQSAGGIAGTNIGTIENCIIEEGICSVKGTKNWSCGGILCGLNKGKILKCTVLEGRYNLDSIIGNNTGEIYRLSNYANIQGGNVASVNLFNTGKILCCANYGEIYSYIGSAGITCSNSGIVEECYNNGKITGSNCMFAGLIRSNLNGGIVRNCYNAGEVRALYNNQQASGIVLYNEGTIENCYNVGKINMSAIAYTNSGKIINSYYLEDSAVDLCRKNTGTIEQDCSYKSKEYMQSLTFVNLINTLITVKIDEVTGEEKKENIIQDIWEKGDKEINNQFPVLKNNK